MLMFKFFKKPFYFIILILLVASCTSGSSQLEKEIASVPVDFKVIRFEKIFNESTPKDLQNLKKKYPAFFPTRFPDSIWINRMQDTLQKQLTEEVVKVFPDEKSIQEKLSPLFKHIKYYFNGFKAPKVYTVLSDVDYDNKVIVTDSLLVLGIDNYLGASHEFYKGLPLYISQNLSPKQLEVDVASSYAKMLISKPKSNSFLDKIIFYGKELYLKDLWLPNATDAQKIGYTESQMQWAKSNEADMWRYFVEKELLFSTDPKLENRFIKPAPFSKFYLEIDNETPGMTGRYLGWQIVRQYMQRHPEISPKQLMIIDAKALFEKSKYKPKK